MSVAPAPVQDPRAAFNAELGAMRQRIWLERAGVIVTRGLMLGFLLTLIVAVAGWALDISIQPLWYAVPLLVPLALSMMLATFFYPSAIAAARAVDHRMGLAEQLSTAVEVIAEDPEDIVPWAQVASASEAAVWAQEHWRGGPRIGRDLVLTAVFGFLAAAALLLTGPEGRSLLPRPPQPPVGQDTPSAAASPVAAVPPKPEQQPATPSPTAQPTGRTAGVQRAVQDIQRSREAGTLDAGEAGRRLAQAEAELSRQTQQSRTDQQSLGRLGEAMDQISAGQDAADALRRGDYEQAAQEIAELGTESDQLSQEAKNQLAQALRQAANDSAASPELAQAERRAADALAGRDYEAARQAMEDLADQVATRGRNVIPQSELGQAWDQLNQERRAQGQPDSNGSARGQEGQQQSRQQSRGQQGQGQQGQQPSQQGQANPAQDGQGIGTAPSTGGPPGEQQLADEAAPRLDAQGTPVEVDLKPGSNPGSRPGDSEEPDDDKPLDETGSISAAATGSPGQVTSSAPPEINFVPSGRRDIVREYFRGPGEDRSP